MANDFGRNNLYRNNGDGTFATVSGEAHVEEAGAGMSACWLDFDNDGNQDIYAAGMWVAAGMRVFGQSHFHDKEPEEIRALYRRHMAGNSLYRNLGNGQFQNVAMQAGVEMGRWSWSTDAWDFDHDGYPDLYMANGYISGHDARDVSSFFWRQVVSKSPRDATPSESYERGWNAINELIRSDATWNGFERNVFFLNNQDGTFSEVSGVVGLDFIDDSRCFVLADLDHDGRLEIILKNRTAPQLRILHNAMKDIGSSIAFRLQGKKSNRDAIGAAVTLEAAGLRQTKYLQAGSGFLSQHSKELFFGLGKAEGSVRASIRWPSGQTQTFENLPANHRIEIQEGAQEFRAKPFAASPPSYAQGKRAARSRSVCRSRSRHGSSSRCLPRFFIAGSCGGHQTAPLLPRKLRSSSFLGHRGAILRRANCGFSRAIRQTGPRVNFAFSVSISMIHRTREPCAPLPQKKGFLCRFFWPRRKWPASTTFSTDSCLTGIAT